MPAEIFGASIGVNFARKIGIGKIKGVIRMRKTLFLILAAILFLSGPAFAQKAQPKTGVDSADDAFYKSLKLQTKKDDATIYQAMGIGYFEQEKFDKSFFFFDKAVKLDPKLYWSWYYLGLLKIETPEDYFKKAIKANAKFAPPYYWLGRYYCKANRIKESIGNFEKYIDLAKNDPAEAERVKTAKHFVVSMQSGQTDYEAISRVAS